MKNTFSTLDGMRGVAAIFVLILHTGSYWGNITFHHSYLAVDLFFLLSGFVIAHAYENKLATKKISVNQFIGIRMIRLYPMYFFSALIASALVVGKYITGVNDEEGYLSKLIFSIILTFSFLPSILPGNILLFPLNTPYWSVFYEVIINITYAFLRPKLTSKILLLIVCVLGTLMILIAALHGSLGAGVSWRPTSIAAGITRSGFGILFGVYLYRVGTSYMVSLVQSAWVLLGLITLVFMAPDLGKFNGLFDILAVFVIFPICIVLGARCKCGYATDYVFSVLGRASYPVYLIHVPMASIVYSLFGELIEKYAPLSGVLFVVGLIIFSIQIEKIYDIPLRRYLTEKFIK